MFQELLSTLKRIAQKQNVNIANVATRYILAKTAVAGVIIGVRLGIVNHINNNVQAFNFYLDKSDCDVIDAVCTGEPDFQCQETFYALRFGRVPYLL